MTPEKKLESLQDEAQWRAEREQRTPLDKLREAEDTYLLETGWTRDTFIDGEPAWRDPQSWSRCYREHALQMQRERDSQ